MHVRCSVGMGGSSNVAISLSSTVSSNRPRMPTLLPAPVYPASCHACAIAWCWPVVLPRSIRRVGSRCSSVTGVAARTDVTPEDAASVPSRSLATRASTRPSRPLTRSAPMAERSSVIAAASPVTSTNVVPEGSGTSAASRRPVRGVGIGSASSMLPKPVGTNRRSVPPGGVAAAIRGTASVPSTSGNDSAATSVRRVVMGGPYTERSLGATVRSGAVAGRYLSRFGSALAGSCGHWCLG